MKRVKLCLKYLFLSRTVRMISDGLVITKCCNPLTEGTWGYRPSPLPVILTHHHPASPQASFSAFRSSSTKYAHLRVKSKQIPSFFRLKRQRGSMACILGTLISKPPRNSSHLHGIFTLRKIP